MWYMPKACGGFFAWWLVKALQLMTLRHSRLYFLKPMNDILLNICTNLRQLLKITFKGLATNIFPWKDLKMNPYILTSNLEEV